MHESQDVHRPDGRRVESEIRTTASPEEVWKAWTDPVSISRWFTDAARGEAKPGGTLVWVFKGFGEIPYPVAVAEPPGRLVLAGEIPGRGPFALEILIGRSGGTTTVRLVNSGFLEGADFDEEYEGVRSGWVASLALLKHYLERHPGKSRQAGLIVRPAAAGTSELYRRFSVADGLAAWLTREGTLGDVGAPAALTLRDGSRLNGRVIAATGREKAVTWDEEDGAVVELKGFAAEGRRMVGVRLTTWGPDCERLARLEREFTPAVERLAAGFSG
ncbi:MAG TPA: SRPBCC domain-containing protein [Gemmatimonadales bacterium]|nr:SRPBCC domain-containing protein [Gemmatimonadales bacterium]